MSGQESSSSGPFTRVRSRGTGRYTGRTFDQDVQSRVSPTDESTNYRDPSRYKRRKGHRGQLFERFTERARQVVVLAQDEARALKHNYIGTQHILLGLLREEEGLAARVLES